MSDQNQNNIDDMATVVGSGFTVDQLKKAAAEKQAEAKQVDPMATVVGGGLTVDQLKKAAAEKQAEAKQVDPMATVVGGGLTVDQLKKAAAEKQAASPSNIASEKKVIEEPKAVGWEDPSNAYAKPQTAPEPKEEPKGFFAKLLALLFGK